MPRSIEQIHRESSDSAALRGLIGVLNDKLQLRARYALLEYEAGMEGRREWSELYRIMTRLESDQITRLSAALASEPEFENPRPLADLQGSPDR
jgi:hypothetical protein